MGCHALLQGIFLTQESNWYLLHLLYCRWIFLPNQPPGKPKDGIQIGGRNINNLRNADDSILTAESKEGLKNLLMRVKEESERAFLRLNIKNTKIMASGPFTTWQIEGENVEVVTEFLFLGAKITADGDCSHEIRRRLLLHRKAMRNLDTGEKQRQYSAEKSPYI